MGRWKYRLFNLNSFVVFVHNDPNGCGNYDTRNPSNPGGRRGWTPAVSLRREQEYARKLALQFQISYGIHPQKNTRKPITSTGSTRLKGKSTGCILRPGVVSDNTFEALVPPPPRLSVVDGREGGIHLPR